MTYRNFSDETLVMLTLAGEQSAYEGLVLRYQSAVLRAASAVTRNRFMAEDATQDAFVTAWMKLDSLDEPKKYGAWVCKIARNCALNTVTRYREYLSLDDLEGIPMAEDSTPLEVTLRREEAEEVRQSVDSLPLRVREIISLHYFEGLSVLEIADRLSITVGTVKSGLHDGRKKLRKELCAMNEKANDTLVEKVMKKVEELKLWQVKNAKIGFETVYRNVLREVEDLPESGKKYHALADTLLCGWWWVEGEQNDALYARIKETAILGKNEDVMAFIFTREVEKLHYNAYKEKIHLISEKLIPELTEHGSIKALGKAWFELGCNFFENGQEEEGRTAMEKVFSLLTPADLYYGMAKEALPYFERYKAEFAEKEKRRYHLDTVADELIFADGKPRFLREAFFCKGYLRTGVPFLGNPLRIASLCDGIFFDETLSVGESKEGSDGTTLTLMSTEDKVTTPAGVFTACRLYVTNHIQEFDGRILCHTWYKEGVGIVKQTTKNGRISETLLLASYHIEGGKGLLPLGAGNKWHYASDRDPAYLRLEHAFTVQFADEKKVLLSAELMKERVAYDESSWSDMMDEISVEYFTEKKVTDVRHAVDRAEALAVTPMEKAHTKAAASVARRIVETDAAVNPNRKARGIWNFFQRNDVAEKNGRVRLYNNFHSDFELKCVDDGDEPLLCNHIYSILQDATKYLWSDEWQVGMEVQVEYSCYDKPLKTAITCVDGGTVVTKAGTFDDCLCLCLDIRGMDSAREYRGGKKEYYFARGIGIVRAVNRFPDSVGDAIYELASYEGTGEGYMPFADGLVRRYEAVGLTDFLVGGAEYTYVADENGNIVIFADNLGIQELPKPITRYDFIYGEQIEEALWRESKRDESRQRWAVNSFNILLHLLCRNPRSYGKPFRAAKWGKYRLSMIENLGDGEAPPAWLGYYYHMTFLYSCYLFGCARAGADCKEEGYTYLERAFTLYEKWKAIPDGEKLTVGDPLLYGDIKVIKGTSQIELPDGTREFYRYADILNPNVDFMYYGMTAPRGWEWFNAVREEERFRAFIQRTKASCEDET